VTASASRPGAGLAILALAAFLWSFAEATYFFLVVDILLTFIALRFGMKAGLLSALAAAIGGALGGIIMWRYAVQDPEAALAMVRSVPFVSEAMIATGLNGIHAADWPLAMLKGSVTGIPYKVYGVGAGEAGLTALAFLAVSIPVRLLRFAAAAALVAWIGDRLASRTSLTVRTIVLALFWIVFYGEFWLRWTGFETKLAH
jgi:hypothetical protein